VNRARQETARSPSRAIASWTHWHLADGTEVEILNWLDDHSRYLLG